MGYKNKSLQSGNHYFCKFGTNIGNVSHATQTSSHYFTLLSSLLVVILINLRARYVLKTNMWFEVINKD